MVAYINKRYGYLYEKYNSPVHTAFSSGREEKYQIWVCWFQGEKNMPELVKICYDSLLKNADGHKVNLITYDNYRDFIDIPDYIVEKHEKNIITAIQLSNIVRACLLSKYGGLWIDATYYVSGKLPDFNGLFFWTPKWNRGEKYFPSAQYLESLLYCGHTDNILACFLKDAFFDHFKKSNKFTGYYLCSALVFCAYNNIKAVKDFMDVIPYAKQGCFDLYYRVNSQYNEDWYNSLCEEVNFHKLTYKEKFPKYTNDKKLTYYGHLWQRWAGSIVES